MLLYIKNKAVAQCVIAFLVFSRIDVGQSRITNLRNRDEPSTTAFLEETYHALQNIEGVQMYKDVTYKGVLYEKVDNWEFLAKKRILDEAGKNGISYEEYIFVEKQLDDVLNNKY